MEELITDLDCAGCGKRLRGRSPGLPGLEPKLVWQSLGRWVTVLAQTIEGRGSSAKVVSHDEALCFACSPRTPVGSGMAPDSWRMVPVDGVVVAPKLKKRKSRSKATSTH